MSEVWFRIKPWSGMASIKAETFEKSTDKFLFHEGGQRTAKITEFASYYPTWDDARKALFERAEKDLMEARQSLDRAVTFHANVRDMKRPEGDS
jgi:hypothetical protein